MGQPVVDRGNQVSPLGKVLCPRAGVLSRPTLKTPSVHKYEHRRPYCGVRPIQIQNELAACDGTVDNFLMNTDLVPAGRRVEPAPHFERMRTQVHSRMLCHLGIVGSECGVHALLKDPYCLLALIERNKRSKEATGPQQGGERRQPAPWLQSTCTRAEDRPREKG